MTGNGDIPIKLKHSISFNTYPNGRVISKCSGIDQVITAHIILIIFTLNC